MASFVRAALFAGSLAAGSWLGLGKPSVDQGRTLVAEAKASADARAAESANRKASDAAAADAKEQAAAEARRADRPVEFGPTPQESDPARVPAMRPWPELNAEASLDKAWMVAEGPAYRRSSGRRLVTLTFDDGPFPETTPAVLRVLAKNNVHATFFVIGRYLDGDEPRAVASRAVLERVVAAGHLVGNHTHDHARLTTVTHTQVLEQIDQGIVSIERVTGKRPILFRPPFGALDEFGRAAVKERGLDLLLWSIEKQDMLRADSHEVFRELVGQIEYKQGGVVLLHDVRWTSVAALRELLGWLHDHRWDPRRPARLGYEIVDMPTYLREVAASPLPFATRDELERSRDARAARSAKRAEDFGGVGGGARDHEARAASRREAGETSASAAPARAPRGPISRR
jgi:peptidoglycan/xylan/chitin deacetylase (PgdA/CDA1 family)